MARFVLLSGLGNSALRTKWVAAIRRDSIVDSGVGHRIGKWK